MNQELSTIKNESFFTLILFNKVKKKQKEQHKLWIKFTNEKIKVLLYKNY